MAKWKQIRSKFRRGMGGGPQEFRVVEAPEDQPPVGAVLVGENTPVSDWADVPSEAQDGQGGEE